MRVLHVLNSATGGAALSTLGLIDRLKEFGVTSCAVCHAADSPAERRALEGATEGRVLFTPLYWWNKKIRANWWKRPLIEARQLLQTGWTRKSTRKVANFAQQQGVDLIHTNTILTLEGAYAARRLGVPHVWHVRELVGRGNPFRFVKEGRAFGEFVSQYADKLVANSEVTARQIRSWFPPGLIEVVPNGIDLSAFQPRTRTPQPRPLVIAMVASLTSQVKKHGLFVNAAALADDRLAIEYRIYGADPSHGGSLRGNAYVDRIHDQVTAAGLRHRFQFPGHIEPAQIMSEIDILVHPADQESFGRVVVEAMAAGLPVVGVRGGGVAEIVVDGQTGILVEPNNAAALATAIEEVACDAALRQRLGEQGRQRAMNCYSLEACVAGIMNIYRSLISNRCATPAGTTT